MSQPSKLKQYLKTITKALLKLQENFNNINEQMSKLYSIIEAQDKKIDSLERRLAQIEIKNTHFGPIKRDNPFKKI